MSESLHTGPEAKNAVFAYHYCGYRIITNRTVAGMPTHGQHDAELAMWFCRDGDESLPRRTVNWPRLSDGRGTRYLFHPTGNPTLICPFSGCCERKNTFIKQALPFALALTGQAALHAAAVDSHGTVAAFVGPSGIGKSTLARVLVGQGAIPVSDDFLLYRIRGAHARVRGDRSAGIGWRPLSVMYFLHRTPSTQGHPEVVPLTQRQTFQALLHNSFCELAYAKNWAFQFESMHRLCLLVPAFELRLPNDPNALHSVLSITNQCAATILSADRG